MLCLGSTTNVDMNFILIPFLLATNLVSNDDAWNNGPEYSFSISVGTITKVKEAKGENRLSGISLTSKLKCRPREPDDLFCHFEDTKIGRLSPRRFDFEEALSAKSVKNATYRPYKLSEASFEIVFDREGIDGYVFEKNERLTVESLTDVSRMLANQLSIGTSLVGKTENFRNKESFTMGECTTEYRVVVHSKIDEKCPKKKLHLVGLTDPKLNEEEVLRIDRQRIPDECVPRNVSYVGSRFPYGVPDGNYTDTLVSSSSNVTISRNCFTSETRTIVDTYDTNNMKKLGSTLDRLRVSLDSIDPARGSLKSIIDPISVDVVVGRSLSIQGTNCCNF